MAGLSTGAPSVKVYHEKSRILPDVSRVLACLYEKGIKFDTCTTSYKSLLKLQASTHTPVPFYDGPTFLEESREICHYIAEKYEHHGHPFLLGKDALERASVEEWLHNEKHAFNPPSQALFCHLAFPPDKDDNVDDIDMHKRKLEEVLEVYEQRLSDSKFLAGNMFTLADLVHLPNSHHITASEFVYLYDSRKNVRRWWDDISNRDSWQQVLMYTKKVEEPNQQEKLKEQQQQKNHPRTPGYPFPIYSRKQTTTEPRTVLIRPASTVSLSPIAPQTEKPLPIDIPDEPLVSSSQSTPTDHKTSVAKSKETPFQEKPPQKSPIPVQSTIAPATSPTTSEKSPIVDPARFSTKDASSPEPTKTDLPTRHKQTSSKDVSNNLHVFYYYKASSHSEEVTAYIESTPQKGSEILNQFSGSSIGHTKTSSIPAQEEPDQRSKSDLYKSDSTSTGVDSQDKDPVPYYEHTTQSARTTDTAASKLHPTDANQVAKEPGEQRVEAPILPIEPETFVVQSTSPSFPATTDHAVIDDKFAKQSIIDGRLGEPKQMQVPIIDARPASPTKRKTPDGLETSDLEHASSSEGKISDAAKSTPPVTATVREDSHDAAIGKKTTKYASGDQVVIEPLHEQARPPARTHKAKEPIGGRQEQISQASQEISRQEDMKYSPSTRDSTKSDIQPPSAQVHEVTHDDDKKVVSPLRSKDPTSQFQPPSGPSQDADSHVSTIKKWQRVSAPLNDMTIASRDATGMPIIDEKPRPWSQQGSRSGHGANHMTKEPGEKRVEAPILPIEPETSDVQSTSPSFPTTIDHAVIDEECAKQSIIDERPGEPKQMQAPITDAHPASPTKRKTPDVLETGDLEHASSSEGQIPDAVKSTPPIPATIREDSPDVAIGKKTTNYDASGDEIITRSLHDQGRPPAQTHEAKEPIGGRRTSKEPQLRGSSQAEVAHTERKSVLSDQKPARSMQPLAPVEPTNIDSDDYEADDTIAPQMTFGQQPRPSAPIIRGVPASARQSGKRKLQEATPDYRHTKDSGKPLAPSQEEQISHGSPEISHQEDMKYSPSARDSTKSDIQPTSAQVQEVMHDDDKKVVSPLRSKHPTSQFQPPSGPSQDADPHVYTIKQWQRPSAPLNDMTTGSCDATGMPTIDEKLRPWSQQGSRSGHGANHMAKEPGEQRVEAPILPTEPETSGVQSTSPSFPATTDHAVIDEECAKQSIIDERSGEPKQMQAPITDAHPASPTKRKTPDGLETGDLEHASSSKGQISDAAKSTPPMPATIREDSPDAAIGKKTTNYDASGDEIITGPLHDQGRPPAQTHEAKELIGGRRTSKEPQLRGSSQAEVAHTERKSALSDQKPGHSTQPLAPIQPANIDSDDFEVDDTIAPQMNFRQQPRPSAPIIREVPASDRQSGKRKLQEATPDYRHTEDSRKPLAPSQEEQISHASQEISRQEDMKYSSNTRDSTKSDILPPSAQVHEVTHDDDKKVVSPLRSKDPTSQFQPPSGPSQDADPHVSTIKKWQRASAPLNDMTIASRDATGMPIIDEKPRPWSQQGSRNGNGANHMTKEPGEQRVEAPIPIEPETSGVQSTSPSFSTTTDHAVIDEECAKQSIIDGRLGEPKQMQAPIIDARPASPTKRKTPDGLETSDLEHASSSEGKISDAAKSTPPIPATVREDSHDVAIGKKTTKYASGDQVVIAPLHEQARPPARTYEAKEPIGGRRTSKEPQLRGSSQAEVAHTERKSALSDQKPARSTQPLAPVEPTNIDSDDYEADDTIAPQMTFQQQARPSAPIIREVPALDRQSGTRKIQEATPDYRHTEDPGKPLVPSQEEQISHASQEISHQEDMKYSPSARDSTKSDIQPPLAQVHEVNHDESGEKQGSHVGSAFRPNEFGPTEKKFVPSSFGHSGDEPSSADPRKEYPVAPTAKQIKALPAVIGQQGTPETREVPTSEDALDTISSNVDVHPTASTKAPRRSFSVQGAEPISSAQAPPFHMARKFLHTGTTPDDALGNAQSMKPSASPDAKHGIAPGNTTDEVTPAEHKFVPSGQDSVHSKQSPPSAVRRNAVIGDSTPETQHILSMSPRKGDVATPDQAKGTRTTLDQQEMLSAPLRSVPPSSDTQRPSEKAREHIPADDLGEAASKPPSDIREVRQPTVVPASAPAARHGAATDEEALDKQKFVPSGQDSVRSTQPPSSLEQRNGRIGDSAPSTQRISCTKPKKGDVGSTPDQAKDSEITLRGQDILPPVRSVSPSSDIQHSSGKVHDVPANDLGEAKPIVQASAPDTQDETARDEAAPDEKEFAPPESTSSTEPSNEERRDSAPSTQLISSTEKIKENATIGALDQGKDLQTTLDQQDILSKPVKSPSPSSDTHRPSKKAREDAPADDLGEATSKPSALVREVRPSTVVPRSTPVTQYGAARDEALDKQQLVPSGQDSVHSALLRNGEIGDPAPSTQQISSTRPRKGDAASSTPEQAKDTQINPGRHNILPPVRLECPSSDTQRPSGKVHEDVPADNWREAEPILQASAPDTQDEKKIVPSEPTSSTEPRNKEIRDSAPSAQLISSTGIRNEDAIIAAPDQDKDLQTTLDQQDILSAPVRSASPSSDTQHPSGKAREDALADDLRIRPLTVVPASGPATLHGAAPNETAHDEQKIVASGQDSAQSVQPSFSTEQTKEETIVGAADQTEDLETIIHRQNITPSTDATKTPLPDTKVASRKIKESISDDIDIDGSIPGEEQVPLGRDEGHATEPYRTAVDEKITTSPCSKAYSSESGSDLTQAHTDVHPSIGEGPTETSFPEHGLQTQPPLATHISLGASNKAKSAGQEAKAPIASASETQPGSTQPQDEAAPIEQNFVVSDQESAHASKSPSTAESRKGETYVFGPADQKNLPLAVLGNQDTRQTPDAREALSKSQESSRDDDGISNLTDQLVRQEQASLAERASEGPTSEVRSATVDEKTALPSSQAGTSDTGPDSTLVTGDAHLTNADMPATSSLQNQEAQPLAATQAPTTQAPPASSQNVHAGSLENIETPRQPSKAPPAPVTSSAAYSDTPHSEPGTATIQTPQEASFDLSGGEKTTTTQGDQVNPLLNGDLSTSQPVRPSESAGFKGTNSKRKLEGASTYEKSKAQHQTDHSEIPSSKDNNSEANEAIRSDLWPKENIESSGESEHQEQADQAVVQSPDGNMKQIEQTKTHDTETGELEERDLQENTNQTNSKVSRVEALDSSGKQTSGVQLRGENRKDASNSADDAPDDIQTRSNSKDNLTSYEESKVQQQSEGKTQGGETEAPLSDTVQQNERGLPENSYQNNSSQSQAEASDKSEEKFSPGIQNKNKSSSVLDGPTDGTKSGDAEDKSE